MSYYRSIAANNLSMTSSSNPFSRNTSNFLAGYRSTMFGSPDGNPQLEEEDEESSQEQPSQGLDLSNSSIDFNENSGGYITVDPERRAKYAAQDLGRSNRLTSESSDRNLRFSTQSTNNKTNIDAQDYLRGVQSGNVFNNFDPTKAATTTSAPVTDTSAGNALADEIRTRQTNQITKATENEPDRLNTSELDIFTQEDPADINVKERLDEAGIDIGEAKDSGIDTSAIATEDDLTNQRTQVSNTLTDVTKDDPALKEEFGDTSNLAIYQDPDNPGINVGERLDDLGINPGESQYTDKIDPSNEIQSEIRARQDRQQEAYQDAVENDPSDSQRGITDPSEGYNPPSELTDPNIFPNLPGAGLTSPGFRYRPGDSDDYGTGDIHQREPIRETRDSNSGTPYSGDLNEPVYNEPTPIARIEAPPEDNVTNAINLMQDGDDRAAWNMLRRTVGLQDGTDEQWQAELNQRGERERIEAEYAARNSETSRRSQTLDMNTMQPIGRQGVVTDETTNTQQQGSSAAEEIDIESESRNNQQALESNESVASGGSDTALMQQPEPAQPEWQSQGFEDEDEMQRFEDKYANYVKTARDIGHLNITDDTKDNMRESFFKVDRPAYKQDQKAKAHNAVIDEAKQRGVDTGVFENVGEVNKWIGRLKKKQAGKFVGYSDESKENYLTENKLDTLMYNKF